MTLINRFTQINNGVISTNNSSQTPLIGGAAFTGTADTVTEYATILVSVYSDVASAANGLSLQFKIDGVWRESDAYTVPAATLKTYSVQTVASQFRIVYTNGATGQTTFELQTQFKKSGGVQNSHRIADDVSGQDDASLTKTVIAAERPGTAGIYTNVQATNGGNLKVAIEEIEPTVTIPTTLADGANLDAFSRLRVSNPTTIFESTFQYDLAPLQYEQITSNGTITHDATDSNALLSISAATGLAALQSYRWLKYQPGKSQLIFITFTLGAAAANVTRRVGLFSATNSGATVTITNGIFLEQTGTSTVNMRIVNAGTQADETVVQADWNIDPMDGSGPSGQTLNLERAQILVIDAQWLGVGRVRVGFDIDGSVCYVHEFQHANETGFVDVYAQTLTLPVRYELTTSASATADMKPICAAVIAEGGVNDMSGYNFVTEFTGTAGNGTRVHLGSLRPFLTFNSIPTRYPIRITAIEAVVTGNNPVLFEIVYGATFSAGPTWAGAGFSAYSGAEITTAAGTIATTPIVAEASYCVATANSKASNQQILGDFYPLTLDANGANRALGTVSIYATGIGNTSACRVLLKWKEIR